MYSTPSWKTFFSFKFPAGSRFSKVPKTFRARKTIRKTPTRIFCKAGLSYVVERINIKNNRKVSCLERPSFWRYKENYVTRNAPEKFRDFRETGPRTEIPSWCSKIKPVLLVITFHQTSTHGSFIMYHLIFFSRSFSRAIITQLRASHEWFWSRGGFSFPSPLYAGSLHLNCVMIALFSCFVSGQTLFLHEGTKH